MKKIKTLLFSLVVGLFLFIGINSNAAIKPITNVSPQMYYPTDDTIIQLGGGEIKVADKSSFETTPFICDTNFDYVQVHINYIKGNSVYFVLQENIDGIWTPALGVSGNEIFVNDNKKTNIYLMYCGKDKTNYTTPDDADTSKIQSVSVEFEERYAIKANHEYRIMIYNPYQWNGKTAYINATLQVKNL